MADQTKVVRRKAWLAEQLKQKLDADLTDKQAKEAVTIIADAIQAATASGDKVTIDGFATFEPRSRSERTGRNPKTGEPMVIAASKTVGIKLAKAFKEALNQ